MYPLIETLKFLGFVFAVYLPLSVGRYYYTTDTMAGYFDNSAARELVLASLMFLAINMAVLLIKNLIQSKKKPKTMMRRTIAGAIFTTGVLLAGFIFLTTKESSFSPPQQPNETTAVTVEGKLQDLTQADQLKSEPSVPETSSSNVPTPKQLVEFESEAQTMLRQSLQGDLEAAISLYDKFKKCQKSEDLIMIAANQASILEKAYEQSPEGKDYGSIDRLLVAAEDKEMECNKFMGETEQGFGFSFDDYFNQVDQEAKQGNTTARFIYSMWTPNDRESFLVGREVMNEYEKKARLYTTYNQADDVKLWLLALGLSYSSGENFTPLRQSLGTVYLLAAKICGMAHPIIDYRINLNARLSKILEIQGIKTSDEEKAFEAQRLASEYCL